MEPGPLIPIGWVRLLYGLLGLILYILNIESRLNVQWVERLKGQHGLAL